MNKEDQRLTLAGHALQGLLANNTDEKGWDINALAVVSLKIADCVIHYAARPELPGLTDSREKKEESKIITPEIITP